MTIRNNRSFAGWTDITTARAKSFRGWILSTLRRPLPPSIAITFIERLEIFGNSNIELINIFTETGIPVNQDIFANTSIVGGEPY